MKNIRNYEGILQANETINATEQPRRQVDLKNKKEEELALRQMISGITPEWREADDKDKKKAIAAMRLWMGGGDEQGEDTDENVVRKEE
eukprot:554010-Pleurochrysis_carterae.AAC.1